MTEKEKMLAGMTYSAIDKQLKDELVVTAEMIHDYNALRPSDGQRRLQMLKELLGHIADDEIIVNQPFYCDYGKQISVGRRFFANFNESRSAWGGGSLPTSTSPCSTKPG